MVTGPTQKVNVWNHHMSLPAQRPWSRSTWAGAPGRRRSLLAAPAVVLNAAKRFGFWRAVFWQGCSSPGCGHRAAHTGLGGWWGVSGWQGPSRDKVAPGWSHHWLPKPGSTGNLCCFLSFPTWTSGGDCFLINIKDNFNCKTWLTFSFWRACLTDVNISRLVFPTMLFSGKFGSN